MIRSVNYKIRKCSWKKVKNTLLFVFGIKWLKLIPLEETNYKKKKKLMDFINQILGGNGR